MRELILRICREEFISVEEISIAVNRNRDYLKNSVIQKLVDSGQLERLYPGNINHPDQKYRAKK